MDNNEQSDAPLEAATSSGADTQKNGSKLKGSINPKALMLGLLGVIVLGGLLTGLIIAGNSDSETASNATESSTVQTANLAAAISLVEGTVQYSSDGQAWIDATGGETVRGLDYVRTAAQSRAVILLDDGSAIRLDADTTMQLTVSDSLAVEVMLMEGQVYSRVVPDASRTFAVVTETERFEALGTAFKTSKTDDVDTLEVYESKVLVDSDGTEVYEGNKYDTKTKEKRDIDLQTLKDDEFAQWNKEKDSQDDKFKDKLGVFDIEEKEEDEEAEEESANTPTQSPQASISLTGQKVDDGVRLNWTMNNGAKSFDGFKIVRAVGDTTPTYRENTSVYVGSPDKTQYVVGLDDGKTYNFRICIYRAASSTCDTYSNNVQVTAPFKQVEAIVPGALTLSIDGDEVSWTTGGTAPHGYKVVLNESGNPTYPANSIQYIGAGDNDSYLPEKAAGTYYVRVCKYTADSSISGGCTDYSNQVEYVVEADESEE